MTAKCFVGRRLCPPHTDPREGIVLCQRHNALSCQLQAGNERAGPGRAPPQRTPAVDQVEQELSASLSERQITELIEDDKVEVREIISEPSRAAAPPFGLEPIDQIDGIVEPTA